ncbi:MAG: haloalkane dehalogenase [Flavobacteriales bacterium]|jgi:haloalkane dehalogenase
MIKILKLAFVATIFSLLAACASSPKSVDTWRDGLKSVDIGNERMAYKTYGDPGNTPVVLLHGMPTSSYLYRNIAPSIAAEGYYVVTPDMVGFGASSKPKDYAEYGMELQGDRLYQLMNQLNLKNAHFALHDMGGLVGFELLNKHPEAISSLFIMNTTAYSEGVSPPKEMKQMSGWMGPMMGSMMRSRFPGKMITGKFIKDNMGMPENLSKEARDNYWWPIHEGSTHAMRSMAKSFDAVWEKFPEYANSLSQFEGPAYILWGAQDKVLTQTALTPQFAKDLKLEEKDVHISADASHFVQEDQPGLVSDKIVMFLNQQK